MPRREGLETRLLNQRHSSAEQRGLKMATILEFRQGQRTSGSSHSGHNVPAEIVFFPGVRYERWDETRPAAKSKKRARRRDRLDLED